MKTAKIASSRAFAVGIARVAGKVFLIGARTLGFVIKVVSVTTMAATFLNGIAIIVRAANAATGAESALTALTAVIVIVIVVIEEVAAAREMGAQASGGRVTLPEHGPWEAIWQSRRIPRPGPG